LPPVLIAFLIVAGIQLVYFFILMAAFLRKRPAQSGDQPPVSVLVCAHDEEENLKELIPALLAQEYPQFEVIVVNDRSNDGTYDYLLDLSTRESRVKMVNVRETPAHVNGKKYGITLGVRAASHEWLLLTDADCRPASSRWIAEMSAGMSSTHQFVLGYSPFKKLGGFLNLFIRFENIITGLQYIAFAWMKMPYMGVGRNLAYRKSFFIENKGFNQHLHVVGGDDDLYVNRHATRDNTCVRFVPEAFMVSAPETSWKSFFFQKVRHLAVGKKYRSSHKAVLALFHLTWVLYWALLAACLVMNPLDYVLGITVFLRIVVVSVTLYSFVKRGNITFEVWAAPVLDFIYPIYYLSTGVVALITKRIRWKT